MNNVVGTLTVGYENGTGWTSEVVIHNKPGFNYPVLKGTRIYLDGFSGTKIFDIETGNVWLEDGSTVKQVEQYMVWDFKAEL